MTINTDNTVEFSQAEEYTYASDEAVEEISQRLIEQNLEAYKELAK